MIQETLKACRAPAQYASAFVLATAMATPTASAAGGRDGVQVVNNAKDFVGSIGAFLQVAFVVTGIGIAGWGVYAATMGRKKREQKEEGVGVPMAAIVGGMLLAGLVYTMGSVSQTLLGNSGTMDTSVLQNGFSG